jgi:Glycosyl transferase family 2
MKAQALLSIVIPTRNRQKQCLETLQAILMYQNDMDLVVFDSSDAEDLRSDIVKLSDDRINYVYTRSVTNITECFEAAVEQATGQFVCMIGDDDGITPYLFEWAKRAAENNISSVSTHESNYAYYNWPDIRSKYFGAQISGQLFFHFEPVTVSNPVNMATSIDKFLGGAGQGCGHLPRIYHGLVSRRTLLQMKAQYGQCFAGVSPDVSFSLLASFTTEKHYVIIEPLTISGSSAVSNAGRSAMRQHQGDLWDDPHMKNFRDETWPADVPAFFSIETVWAQATLAAIQLHDPGMRVRFNHTYLHVLLLVRHPDRARQTMASFRKLQRAEQVSKHSYISISITLIRTMCADIRMIFQKLLRKAFPDPRVTNMALGSIIDASDFIRYYFTKYMQK